MDEELAAKQEEVKAKKEADFKRCEEHLAALAAAKAPIPDPRAAANDPKVSPSYFSPLF